MTQESLVACTNLGQNKLEAIEQSHQPPGWT